MLAVKKLQHFSKDHKTEFTQLGHFYDKSKGDQKTVKEFHWSENAMYLKIR